MDAILKGIPNLSLSQRIRDDDQVDQLHHFVTVYLLILSALIVGVKELAGQPLDCWVTKEKWGHFQAHANSYCWANKLYPYPNATKLSEMPFVIHRDGSYDQSHEGVETLNSYKWITVVFIVQALLFKLPDLLWAACNSHSGTKMEQVVGLIKEATLKKPEVRRTDLNVVAEFLEIWLKLNGRKENLKSGYGKELAWGFEFGLKNKFLSSMYIIVKICYLLNILVQFFFLSIFLNFNFWDYGRKLMQDGEIGGNIFPLAALCHFEIKGESEWVQCLLLMNMLMEKIFMVQWFWFLTLLAISVFNFISWLPKIFRRETGLKFIKRFLCVLCKNTNCKQTGRGTVRHFVCHYLGQDGVFLLRLISINTSTVATAELVACLWNRYLLDQTDATVGSDAMDHDEYLNIDGESSQLKDRQKRQGKSRDNIELEALKGALKPRGGDN